jgi:hypothetical protein
LNGAELGLAGSGIADALKIPADFDAGPDKPALLQAALNLHVSGHRHAALKKCGHAASCRDISADRRRLLRCIDGETGILPNLHVSGDGGV